MESFSRRIGIAGSAALFRSRLISDIIIDMNCQMRDNALVFEWLAHSVGYSDWIRG